MRARTTKDCYCYTCGREFNYLGIALHIDVSEKIVSSSSLMGTSMSGNILN